MTKATLLLAVVLFSFTALAKPAPMWVLADDPAAALRKQLATAQEYEQWLSDELLRLYFPKKAGRYGSRLLRPPGGGRMIEFLVANAGKALENASSKEIIRLLSSAADAYEGSARQRLAFYRSAVCLFHDRPTVMVLVYRRLAEVAGVDGTGDLALAQESVRQALAVGYRRDYLSYVHGTANLPCLIERAEMRARLMIRGFHQLSRNQWEGTIAAPDANWLRDHRPIAFLDFGRAGIIESHVASFRIVDEKPNEIRFQLAAPLHPPYPMRVRARLQLFAAWPGDFQGAEASSFVPYEAPEPRSP